MAIYEIIEEIMVGRDLSVADIARICNIPDSTVRGIIRRKQDSIALEVAFKLSAGLGVSLEKLNGMPEKDPPGTDESAPKEKPKNIKKYSDEAMQLAHDYDGLDSHGKRIVRVVADEEMERMTADRQEKSELARAERERTNREAAEEMPTLSLDEKVAELERQNQEKDRQLQELAAKVAAMEEEDALLDIDAS